MWALSWYFFTGLKSNLLEGLGNVHYEDSRDSLPQRLHLLLHGIHDLSLLQARKVSAATSQMMEKAAAASSEGVTVLSVVTEDAILYTYHIPSFKSGQTPTLALHDERYLLSKGDESVLQAN